MHTSTKVLLAEMLVASAALALLSMAGFPLLFPYRWHKLLHIFGAALFLGNILVTGVWMALAEQNGHPATLHFATQAVQWADVAFTAPGVLLILSNGLIMAANEWGGLWGSSWISVALGLFTLSGVVWVGFLLRYQDRMIHLSANPGAPSGQLSETFFQVLHRWYFWGLVATILPLASLVLMVLKPRFW